jgi:malonyl CoA-acyl carrier protein transacylase
MTCYVFPGQGSQKVGMGEDVFEKFPDKVTIANEILGYDIKKVCLEDPKNELNQTQVTQPALFIVSALSYLAYQEENNTPPLFVAGHSLGEYNALFAANVIDFETGIKLVKKRGDLMSKSTGGAMAAIVGISAEQIQAILIDNKLDDIDIANFNEPKQTVISGESARISQAKPIFEAAGVRRYIPLAVSGAFHSRYMEAAKQEFEAYLDSFTFLQHSIPVVANVTADIYSQSDVKTLLSKQITHSVRWVDSIAYLLNQNVEEFIEIGPGKVLTGLINKIKLSLKENSISN